MVQYIYSRIVIVSPDVLLACFRSPALLHGVLPAGEVKANAVSTWEQNGKLGSSTKRHETFEAIWKPRTGISPRRKVELMHAGRSGNEPIQYHY